MPQHGREAFHEHPAGHLDTEILDRDNLVASALGRLEVEGHRRWIARRRRQARQALETRALTLRLE